MVGQVLNNVVCTQTSHGSWILGEEKAGLSGSECACVCGVCVHMCLSVCCMRVYVFGVYMCGGQRLMLDVFLECFPIYTNTCVCVCVYILICI